MAVAVAVVVVAGAGEAAGAVAGAVSATPRCDDFAVCGIAPMVPVAAIVSGLTAEERVVSCFSSGKGIARDIAR